jgi:hypothetical protein
MRCQTEDLGSSSDASFTSIAIPPPGEDEVRSNVQIYHHRAEGRGVREGRDLPAGSFVSLRGSAINSPEPAETCAEWVC